jgi:hypothetical protein
VVATSLPHATARGVGAGKAGMIPVPADESSPPVRSGANQPRLRCWRPTVSRPGPSGIGPGRMATSCPTAAVSPPPSSRRSRRHMLVTRTRRSSRRRAASTAVSLPEAGFVTTMTRSPVRRVTTGTGRHAQAERANRESTRLGTRASSRPHRLPAGLVFRPCPGRRVRNGIGRSARRVGHRC